MNCKQLNAISLEEVLAGLGHLPVKQNNKETWYLSPFGAEKQASFKVDKRLNLWYLFSEGVGGTTTDLVQKYFGTSVNDVLRWASGQNFSSFHQQIKPIRKITTEYRIEKVMDLHNIHLMDYLRQRGLSSKTYPYVKEVWFTIKDKSYYAVGFQNLSNGWELRNPYYKGALLNKDISILHTPPAILNAGTQEFQQNGVPAVPHDGIPERRIAVTEGFMDALSFIEMQTSYRGDLLVLNSISLLGKVIETLKDYTEINLFLDNDNAGKKCTAKIIAAYPHAKDYSYLYSSCKDLNEHLIAKRQRKALSAQNTGNAPQKEAGSAEQQEGCTKETNRIKKGMRRRM
ncbi:toprim domain-containing protein [Chryseobacterium vaccae]|uniref:toprim domain-containing protein n=1 Tax=Chryseobacterium vaccae TaxID=2604424 RepID=UPI0012963097|nr:toprim domain-containing protein [Chryseobacterium vaccae]